MFWGFSFKTKNQLFRGSIIVVFKTQISSLFFLRLFFNVKGSFKPIFTKKILIFGPLGIFKKWKLWSACDGAGWNFGLGLEICTTMKFSLPLPYDAYAHCALPRRGKKFWCKKRRIGYGPVGFASLWFAVTLPFLPHEASKSNHVWGILLVPDQPTFQYIPSEPLSHSSS